MLLLLIILLLSMVIISFVQIKFLHHDFDGRCLMSIVLLIATLLSILFESIFHNVNLLFLMPILVILLGSLGCILAAIWSNSLRNGKFSFKFQEKDLYKFLPNFKNLIVSIMIIIFLSCV
ncbi:hypothetical protein DY083_06020 [Apilactobacillus timberlakei]|nr:hypothetical protein DYZ95_06970 [Apilactobacillus timberlakei]TPR21576.1 hypothetical protein DY083_06020 [Apilactobacillus timberlakei]